MHSQKWTWGVALLCAGIGVNASAVDMALVTVANPGNPADTRFETPGWGGVSYTYQIGKYEVTFGQYAEFLNAVAKTDRYGLYRQWGDIIRDGTPGDYTYTVRSGAENLPVTYVSWSDAARFANWMHNCQPTGEQNLTTTENGSYYLNGATTDEGLMAVTRKPNATWVLPTGDEWYKAAYHKNNGATGDYWMYPTGSDEISTSMAGYGPYELDAGEVGTYSDYPSAYGTLDQAGNRNEWNESEVGSGRGLWGGCYAGDSGVLPAAAADAPRYGLIPSYTADNGLGFRVAKVGSATCPPPAEPGDAPDDPEEPADTQDDDEDADAGENGPVGTDPEDDDPNEPADDDGLVDPDVPDNSVDPDPGSDAPDYTTASGTGPREQLGWLSFNGAVSTESDSMESTPVSWLPGCGAGITASFLLTACLLATASFLPRRNWNRTD